MNSRSTIPAAAENQSARVWGERILALMDAAEAPSLFSRKGLYGTLMEWAMKDEDFKTQLFRFVDVLPTLQTSSEVTRHLNEYFDGERVRLSPALRAALKAGSFAGGLFNAGLKSQITGMARLFMLGNDDPEVIAALRRLHEQGIAFTVDVLGEAVVSEEEADRYAQRYLDLMNLLARATGTWGPVCASNRTPRGDEPSLNLSLKISALYSQTHPADPDTAIDKWSGRLRPILRRANEVGAFINFDMEHFGLKDLTLRLFKSVFSEPEFAGGPRCGLALQAYLKECEADLEGIVDWARTQRRRITVRLVKGAYWDYETIMAQQKGWPVPVFSRKAETDANFEKLATYLLEHDPVINAAFATHNVRSIAHVLAHAEQAGVPRRHFEFQMLHGMAESLKAALVKLDCRVREYAPVGELLPGMAYLVRRLLENTSNEGFLANKFAKGAGRDDLLRDPLELLETPSSAERGTAAEPGGAAAGFKNEPHTDFNDAVARERLREAIASVRARLGRQHALIIDHKPVRTREWTPSLNPANQKEVIGHAARATVAEAELAVAAACRAQLKWARVPASDRAAVLNRLADRLRRDKAELCALEILEAGKSWSEADADVAEAIDFCNYYADQMRSLARSRRTQRVAGESNVQHWWPRGVGVVIAPWNFPLAILTGMVSAALVAGNAVIFKPSEQTPVIAGRLMEALMDAGAPAGVVNLLTGPGSQVGAHLVAHPRVDFIAFTGSKEVGLKIWETAGRTAPGALNLKKVVCEMGGKNCVIVDNDADLDEAVAGVVQSAFGYQGQKCSALSRLVVLAGNHDRFLARLIAATDSLRVGPAEEAGTMLGPVIDRQSQRRIAGMIEIGMTEATLAWQGTVPDDPDACYVPPTIFTGVAPGARIFREEIFGPVLAVSRAEDFDEALALANDCEFALTGGCYSRSPAHIERAKNEMVCGNLYINRPITGALVERQPFGGFRLSGGGTKAGGGEYLPHFLVPRVITENCLRRGFAPTDEE